MRLLRIVVALSAVMVGLIIVPVDEDAGALSLATAGSSFPPNCGGGILTPVKIRRLLVSRVEAECNQTGPIPYWRLKVALQQYRANEGIWRNRAIAVGEASVTTEYFLVKTVAGCKRGRHRTHGVLKYRFNISEPWTLAWRANSGRLVRNCPS